MREQLSGVEEIAEERQEQINKHGWDLSHDQDYGCGELIEAAQFSINPSDDSLWPWNDSEVGTHFRDKIKAKDRIQQLRVAGAFIAAEIDRLKSLEP